MIVKTNTFTRELVRVTVAGWKLEMEENKAENKGTALVPFNGPRTSTTRRRRNHSCFPLQACTCPSSSSGLNVLVKTTDAPFVVYLSIPRTINKGNFWIMFRINSQGQKRTLLKAKVEVWDVFCLLYLSVESAVGSGCSSLSLRAPSTQSADRGNPSLGRSGPGVPSAFQSGFEYPSGSRGDNDSDFSGHFDSVQEREESELITLLSACPTCGSPLA